jgi:hypothetical protein
MQRGLKAPSIAKRSSLAGAQVNTHTDPLQWLDWSTLAIYFLVPPYLPTSKLGQMSQDPLLYPPQMRNSGSLLACLSTSLDNPLDTFYWLRYNWLQPPPRAPDWVIDWELHDNWPLDYAICEYKEAAGLPLLPRGGHLLLSIRIAQRPPTGSGSFRFSLPSTATTT